MSQQQAQAIQQQKLEEQQQKQAAKVARQQPKEKSIFESSAVKQVERTAASIITRSLLGALGLGGRTKRLW